MRKNLYMFRCDKRLSQRQISEKIGVHRETYASVERGDRNGTLTFWRKFQTAFDIPDGEIMGLCEITLDEQTELTTENKIIDLLKGKSREEQDQILFELERNLKNGDTLRNDTTGDGVV